MLAAARVARILVALLVAGLSILARGRPGAAETSPPRARVAEAARRGIPRLRGALRAKKAAPGDEIFVRIFKEEGELEVWLRHGAAFDLVKRYRVCARSGGLGPKEKVGDEQAPEGFYTVTREALNPASRYHLAFNLGYPNAFDRAHGRTGSAIMVHGDCVSIGCFAMTDDGIDEIYSLADAALSPSHPSFAVHVFPFRMTRANLHRHAASKWAGFWANLKEGYDRFEATHVPPTPKVSGGRYVF